jgi:hypothetical protein
MMNVALGCSTLELKPEIVLLDINMPVMDGIAARWRNPANRALDENRFLDSQRCTSV